jgi:hypothetical protein
VEIAKSAAFNSPQLAALGLNLSFIDTPWLAAGKFIFRGWKPLPQGVFYGNLDFTDKRLPKYEIAV